MAVEGNSEGLWEKLMEAGNSKTILLSTHILSDVEELADTIFIMKEGEIVAETAEQEQVEELYMTYFEEP